MKITDVKPGRYILPDGKWMQIEGIGRDDYSGCLMAVYYIHGDVDKKGKIRNRACIISDLIKLNFRPMQDSDYPGGSAAAFYGTGNP